MSVKAKPDGYHTVTPYLIVKDAAGAIEFYQKVFGARSFFAWAARTESRACRAQDRRFGGDAGGGAPRMGALSPARSAARR